MTKVKLFLVYAISKKTHFKNIQKQIKDRFETQLNKTNITYNAYNNVNSINAAKSIGTNILSSTKISKFWSLFTSRKNVSCSAMNFKIGDNYECGKKHVSGKILFLKEDEEYDGYDVFRNNLFHL